MPVLDVQVLSHGASLVLLPESATVRITAVDADGPRKRLEGSDLVFARTSVIEVRNGKPVREIDLIPTDGTFCYQVAVTTTVGAFKFGRYITVPDVPGPVRLGDRPAVDPSTFQPTADVIAAWREVTAEVIAARDSTYAARTAAEAAASTASTAATAADTAKTSAAASAAAAGVAAGYAGDAATAAGRAATGAGLEAGAAEGFARDADASATGALQSRDAAGTSAGSAATSATEAAGSAATATQQATDAAESATTAAQAATTATGAATDAAASKTSAETSAATADARAKDATSSATAAAGSATTAEQRAAAAGQSATAAASSAATADGLKTDAQTARTGAQAAQTAAETAQTGAQTAKGDAEKARDLALAGQFAGTLVTAGADLNTMLTPGVYRFTSAVAGASTNIPNTGAGILFVYFVANGVYEQRYVPSQNPYRGEYVRGGATSAGLGSWRFLPSQRVNSPAGQPGVEVFTQDDVNAREQQLMPISTDLGTVDLNAVQVPGAYKAQTSTNATLARNYPAANVGGLLEVHSTSTNVVMQRFTITHGAGGVPTRAVYQRRLFSGSWDTWRMLSTLRVDQSAGRAAYMWDDLNGRDQLIYGDTGWRNITTSTANGWSANNLSIRRVGHRVTLVVESLSGAAATGDIAIALPAGFSGAGLPISPRGLFHTAAYPAVAYRMFVGGVLEVRLPGWTTAMSPVFGEASWYTSDAWPTSLPGSASGTIPNA